MTPTPSNQVAELGWRDLTFRLSSTMDTSAHMFVWAEGGHLPQALEAIRLAGFTYKTVAFVWVRNVSPLFTGDAEPESMMWLHAIRGKGIKRASAGVSQVVRVEGDLPVARSIIRGKIVELLGVHQGMITVTDDSVSKPWCQRYACEVADIQEG